MSHLNFTSAFASAMLLVGVSACHKAAPPPPPPAQDSAPAAAPVAKATQPATVENIQQKLVDDGAKLSVDGKMGARTKSALKKFQSKNGLKVSGKADSETLAKLGLE